MAITDFNEIWSGRKGTETDKSEEYERVFRIITDNPLDGPKTVLGSLELPQILDHYEDANGTTVEGSFCIRREPIQDQDDPCTWTVRCQFTTDISQTPWNNPPELSFSFEKYQKPIYQSKDEVIGSDGSVVLDFFGDPVYKAIVNSSGEMFDPPPTIDDSRPVFTVKVNVMGFIGSIAIEFQDAVNTDTFFGFEPGKVKVDSIAAVRKNLTVDLSYWEVTYTFHVRREGWKLFLLDAGYKELTLVNGPPIRQIQRMALDPQGHPFSSPVPLDGAGKRLRFRVDEPISEQLTWLQFTVYNEKAFADLHIPGAS